MITTHLTVISVLLEVGVALVSNNTMALLQLVVLVLI